jgi:hypothetical protein
MQNHFNMDSVAIRSAVLAVLPSPWFNVGTRILLDGTGRISNVVEASKLLRFTSPSAAIVNHIEKCLAGLIEGAKRTLRNDPMYASRLCSEAVHHLLVADESAVWPRPIWQLTAGTLGTWALTKLARSAPQDADVRGFAPGKPKSGVV